MKLVTFRRNSEQRIGAYEAKKNLIIDLDAGHSSLHGHRSAAFKDMLSLIDAGEEGRDLAERVLKHVIAHDVSSAQASYRAADLLAPLPEPRQMRDCLAFERHYAQARQQALRLRAQTYPDPAAAEAELAKSDEFKIPPVWYEQPVYYKGNRFSVVGTEHDVLWPSHSNFLDYELEYGIVIAKRGKDIRRAEAHNFIFGYCIFNDMSARDSQYKEYPVRLGPAKGKDFDTGNILGPWLVTADEMTCPYDLNMVARVNGEEWSRGYSGDIYHRFDRIIEHISRDETLHPGEFIGSGTVGNGCGLELGRRLKPNDVVELEIDGLGCLRNRVVRDSQHGSDK